MRKLMKETAGTECLNCAGYGFDCNESLIRDGEHCCAWCSHRHTRKQRRFSPREIQILRGVAAGVDDKGISNALGISRNVIDTRLRNARRKTRCADRFELAASIEERSLM